MSLVKGQRSSGKDHGLTVEGGRGTKGNIFIQLGSLALLWENSFKMATFNMTWVTSTLAVI